MLRSDHSDGACGDADRRSGGSAYAATGMSGERAIVVRGDFTDAEFTRLVALIRLMDEARPGAFFEIVAVDPAQHSMEIADLILRGALPPMAGRETTFRSIKRPPDG